MAAVNEMRLPDFSVCLQAQVGIMPLKGKCIPRVQRVVLILYFDNEQAARHLPYRPYLLLFDCHTADNVCLVCFTQILPVTVITAVPGVTETVPSVFVANVAAGTSIAPAVVSNTPVASL